MNGEASVTGRKTRGRNAGLVLGIGVLASLMTYASISADNAPKVAPAKSAGPAASSRGVGSGVPLQINHQGVVQSGGIRFNGAGLFRFAIVDPDTSNQVWTNDGTSMPGPGTPTAAVSVTVTNGVYSVALGDTALANMTAVPSSIFSDDNVVLRIWFDDGTNGVQQLTPDHPLSTSPYAFRAAVVSAAEGLNRPGTSTAAVTVDASGNVGVGTGSPGGRLHVSDADTGGGGALSIIETTGAPGLTSASLAFHRSGVEKKVFAIDGVDDLTIHQGDGSNSTIANRLFIKMFEATGFTFFGGKVGLGTVNPSARLTIQGTNQDANDALRIQSNSPAKGWNIFPQDVGAFSTLRFNNGQAEGSLSDTGVWTNGSDKAYKKDISQITYGLQELMKLQPRKYKMKASGKKQIGFIAQEIETILPELVFGEEGAKSLSYGQLTAVITRAVQQQQIQIEQLKAENLSMKKHVERLEAQVNRTRVSR